MNKKNIIFSTNRSFFSSNSTKPYKINNSKLIFVMRVKKNINIPQIIEFYNFSGDGYCLLKSLINEK